MQERACRIVACPVAEGAGDHVDLLWARLAWLLSRRVAAARALLEETDLPVEAVATRLGLASPVNLRRRFRAQVGTTPGAYRRAFRSQ